MTDNWLELLKAGDKVVVAYGWGMRANHQIENVERTTATQIVLPNGQKYRRSDGRKKGNRNWQSCRLVEATDELIAEIDDINRRSSLKYYVTETTRDFRQVDFLTTEELQQIHDIVDAATKRKADEP